MVNQFLFSEFKSQMYIMRASLAKLKRYHVCYEKNFNDSEDCDSLVFMEDEHTFPTTEIMAKKSLVHRL